MSELKLRPPKEKCNELVGRNTGFPPNNSSLILPLWCNTRAPLLACRKPLLNWKEARSREVR